VVTRSLPKLDPDRPADDWLARWNMLDTRYNATTQYVVRLEYKMWSLAPPPDSKLSTSGNESRGIHECEDEGWSQVLGLLPLSQSGVARCLFSIYQARSGYRAVALNYRGLLWQSGLKGDSRRMSDQVGRAD
jgi:hypothetical protein